TGEPTAAVSSPERPSLGPVGLTSRSPEVERVAVSLHGGQDRRVAGQAGGGVDADGSAGALEVGGAGIGLDMDHHLMGVGSFRRGPARCGPWPPARRRWWAARAIPRNRFLWTTRSRPARDALPPS